jgi:hypothetical protein
MWPSLVRLTYLDALRPYRTSTTPITIEVNYRPVEATDDFDAWCTHNKVKVGTAFRSEIGLLLFVYHALHDDDDGAGTAQWTATEDEEGDPWGSQIVRKGSDFYYNGKRLVVKKRSPAAERTPPSPSKKRKRGSQGAASKKTSTHNEGPEESPDDTPLLPSLDHYNGKPSLAQGASPAPEGVSPSPSRKRERGSGKAANEKASNKKAARLDERLGVSADDAPLLSFDELGVLLQKGSVTQFYGTTFVPSGPLVFGKGRVVEEQPWSSPVILLREVDREVLDEIMKANRHEGAFGGDYAPYRSGDYPEIDTVLWKIPGDILEIDGIDVGILNNIGMHVGTYPMWIDRFVDPKAYPKFEPTTVNGVTFTTQGARWKQGATEMTKLRFDFDNFPVHNRLTGRPYRPISGGCHVLSELTTKQTFPMMGTHFWFSYHWDADYETIEEKKNLEVQRDSYRAVIQNLKKIKIEAISVRGQHHALVFVRVEGKSATMPTFVGYIKSNENALREAIEPTLLGSTQRKRKQLFDEWYFVYSRFEEEAFDHNKWISQGFFTK